MNVLRELNAKSHFDFVIKDSNGSLEASLGIRKATFDIIESRVDRYSFTIIVTRHSDGWMQMIMTIYSPNHMENRRCFGMNCKGLGLGGITRGL